MNLAVIGTGYVGLVAGAGFADFGNDVSCVDIDTRRVERLRQGEVPIHEPGLPELIGRNMRAGRLSFTTQLSEAVAGADVVLIAVGTPPLPDGSADLRQVLSAADGIGRALTGPAVVATKSTVPVGTAEKVRDAISAHARVPFAVASNPEFLKEGSAVEDFLRPMRVVLGVGPGAGGGLSDEQARTVLRRLYEPVVRTGDRLLFTDARSAELTKYAANAYLATRISFMNDLANLCEHLGADVEMVRRGMGMDTRIGPKFLFAGLGFGGSCFPKDVQALLSMARAHGRDLQIVAATTRINDAQRLALMDKMERHFGGGPDALAGRTVAVWGLSFKPETDDVREAPALSLIEALLHRGAAVRATDPAALKTAGEHFGDRCERAGLHLVPGAYEAAQGADALVLCTEWRQYRQPNFRRLREVMAGTGIFDGRNIWDPEQVRELGFHYHGIGRPI